MKKWSTQVNIESEGVNTESKIICYLRDIFQGDSLSVIFLSCVSIHHHFCSMGLNGNRTSNITHLVFVDDLKLYSTNMINMKLLLDQVTTFSNDIGMKLDESKCAYMVTEKGTLIEKKEPIIINNVKIKPMEKGESYKYLDQDESISYEGPVNNESAIKEYKNRVRKI